mgnify:CR=1 FL=1
MNKFAKKMWTVTYLAGCLAIIAGHVFLVGCVEVGGGSSSSGAEVCSGTECSSNHNESNNSTDNSTD